MGHNGAVVHIPSKWFLVLVCLRRRHLMSYTFPHNVLTTYLGTSLAYGHRLRPLPSQCYFQVVGNKVTLRGRRHIARTLEWH